MKAKVVMLSILTLLIVSSQVSAYVPFGGRWGSDGDPVTLSYYIDSSVSSYGYQSRVQYGASQWNGVHNYYSISETSNANINNIKVFAGDTNDTSWADALNYRSTWWGGLVACWDCTYFYSRIRINEPEFKKESIDQQKKTMTHEFGHAAGLDHSNASRAIMLQGRLGYNTLQTDDESGLLSIYEP